MARKRDSERGETLVEVLASVLVCVLSVTLLFGAVTAAERMGESTDKADKDYYAALTAAETYTEPAEMPKKEGTLTITGAGTANIGIDIYGGSGIYSYKKRGTS